MLGDAGAVLRKWTPGDGVQAGIFHLADATVAGVEDNVLSSKYTQGLRFRCVGSLCDHAGSTRAELICF